MSRPTSSTKSTRVGQAEQLAELHAKAVAEAKPADVIAVSNLKGGVAKTTTAVSLGACYASEGHRVLILDIDPQGSGTQQCLGGPAPDGGEGLYGVLTGRDQLVDCAVPIPSMPTASIIPSARRVGQAQSANYSQPAGGQLFLRRALQKAAGRWDVVLIDCPPENEYLLNCALAAANRVLVPCLLESAATRQLAELTHRVGDMRSSLNPTLTLCGVVATRVNARRGLTNELWDDLQNVYGALLFETFVRDDPKVAEADGHAKSVLHYAKRSKGSKDYLDVYKELKMRISAAELEGAGL